MRLLDLKKDYHVHCNYNDHSTPDLTIKNVVKQGEKIGLSKLAFTEHVRRTSTWIEDYLDEIVLHSKQSKITIIPGFEAKILKDGSIDCPEYYMKKYLVIASFHTMYNDKSIWINALRRTMENPDVDIIGHLAPEPTFKIVRSEIESLAYAIVRNKKIVEINVKYRRPIPDWIRAFNKMGVMFCLGSDAHSLRDVGNFTRISDLVSLVSKP